jgi:hypothetical protein
MCGVNATVSVPVAPANAAPITAAIAQRAPTGATPTRAALNAAVAYLSSLADQAPKFILLATDGLPTCNPASMASTADDSAGAVQAVSAARAAGIGTFVIGIGYLQSDVTLSQMATEGGYARSDTPSYYPVTSTADLTTALGQIVGIARTCHFSLGAPPPGGSFDAIDVRGDGTAIPRDPTHTAGWDYSSPAHDAIDLHGAACNAAMSGTIARVSVVFRCS